MFDPQVSAADWAQIPSLRRLHIAFVKNRKARRRGRLRQQHRTLSLDCNSTLPLQASSSSTLMQVDDSSSAKASKATSPAPRFSARLHKQHRFRLISGVAETSPLSSRRGHYYDKVEEPTSRTTCDTCAGKTQERTTGPIARRKEAPPIKHHKRPSVG